MRITASLLLTCAFAAACAPGTEAPPLPRLGVVDVLGADNAGFEHALEPRHLEFPRDHGAHPGFASEWWYATGNLESEDGRHFGYQLTFFRISLLPAVQRRRRDSSWATDEVWMAHFALTDVDADHFHAFDRFQRGALGLAGAQGDPWRVWLDDWSLEQIAATPLRLRLRAREGTTHDGDGGVPIAIDLTLEERKPMVMHGEQGLSRKGPTPGNASYYYSYTRLRADGVVQTVDGEHRVTGSSWLDREWSSSVLEAGLVGWDWFALQLDDDTELMYYQLRQGDGSASPYSAATLVAADGTYTVLAPGSVELRTEGSWASLIDGTAYPSGWTLSVPDRGIALRIDPAVDAQELDLAFRYWEGAVVVRGTGAAGRPVSGRGYVELTGYAEGGQYP